MSHVITVKAEESVSLYMEKDVVHQSHWELSGVVYLSVPVCARAQVDDGIAGVHGSDNCQPGKWRPSERHGTPPSREVPDDNKNNLIAAFPEVVCDVERVVVPLRQWAASSRSEGNPYPVYVELIPRVCRAVQARPTRRAGEVKCTGEPGHPTSSITVGGINPVGDPDPIGLELVDRLRSSASAARVAACFPLRGLLSLETGGVIHDG